MKTKHIFTIALAAAALTSCNMDLAPVGSIDERVALESVSDAVALRNGLYGDVRGITSSQFFTYADIQCDMFNGLSVNGNRMGAIANGEIYSSNSEPESYWNAFWGCVGDCNYFLAMAPAVYEKYVAENEEAKAERMMLYIAEAHFIRGYIYALMFDRWCELYSPEIADKEGTGLPIVTVFDPSPDRSTYPARATMNETIEFFLQDIQEGYNGIKEWEDNNKDAAVREDVDGRLKPNTPYISSWCCKALQARIALWLGEYEKARTLAQEVIDSGIYQMATTATFVEMWKKDASTEFIFLPYESISELGSAIGASWLNNMRGADYIPSSTVVSAYKASGTEVDRLGRVTGYRDRRFTAFIEDRDIKSAFGKIKAPCFSKYPGNPTLQTTSDNNYVNKPKPFRITEMYFIVAECAYELGDEVTANKILKDYMEHRIVYDKTAGQGYEDLSGEELQNEIRKQRGLEFIGEGFRLSDLRRWHKGFNRANGINYASVGYNQAAQILTKSGLEVVYTDNDHRYTWPIPSTELQVNPQMAGQQNPGY